MYTLSRKFIKVFFLAFISLELLTIFFAQPTLAATSTNKNDPTGSCQRLQNRYNDIVPGQTTSQIFPRYCTVSVVVLTALNILFALSGTVAVLFIVIGGFQYMASAGNQEIADKGKKTLTYAVIGLIVIVLATTIVNITVSLLLKG